MTDQWIPAPPPVPGPPPVNFPLADSWNRSTPCPVGANVGIVDGVIITGVPATIGSVVNGNYAWTITLNDGSNPPNFSIDRYNAAGDYIDSPMTSSGVNGSVQFNDDVYLSHDPVSPMEAATKEYVDTHSAGVTEAPTDGQQYGRQNEGWTVINNPIASDAPADNSQYGRQNNNWTIIQPPVITSDAPADGSSYVRQNNGWFPLSAAITGYMPLSGGTFTGPVIFTPNNGIQIVGAAGTGRTIFGATGSIARWQMQLGNNTPEGGGNAGSDFSLTAISDTGSLLSTPLTITRSTGAITVGITPGVTPLALNGAAGTWRSVSGQTNGSMRWQMFLGNPTGELGSNFGSNFQLTSYTDAGTTLATPLQIARQTGVATFSQIPSFPGGAAGQALTTDGSGNLSWGSVASGPPVTISDTAPASPAVGALWWDSVGGQLYTYYNDGNSSQWVITVNAANAPVVQIGAAPPGNPQVGQLYWDNVGAQLYVYYNDGNSSQWVPTSNQLGGGYLQKAGVTDGSDAPAGQIGEVISAANTAGVALTTGVVATVTSISLPPGDWDVSGDVWIGPSATATVFSAGINNSATLAGFPAINATRTQLVASIGGTQAFSLRPCRASLSTTTTYYLLANCNFASGTCNALGSIWARRAR